MLVSGSVRNQDTSSGFSTKSGGDFFGFLNLSGGSTVIIAEGKKIQFKKMSHHVTIKPKSMFLLKRMHVEYTISIYIIYI